MLAGFSATEHCGNLQLDKNGDGQPCESLSERASAGRKALYAGSANPKLGFLLNLANTWVMLQLGSTSRQERVPDQYPEGPGRYQPDCQQLGTQQYHYDDRADD